jgi:hypothetical protein
MTVSQAQETQTPSETIAQQIKHWARQGLGHEDICVILKKQGVRLSPNGKERVRQIVLKRTTASLPGAPERGR